MTIFSCYIFLIIVALGGIGVDVMRHERDRARLQSVLDRAVLAAADLDQTQDPKDVVMDYLTKEGLQEYIDRDTDIIVTPERSGEENIGPLGYRIVEATARSSFPTQFMHISGVDTLSVQAHSIAEERIGEVEISLVLDVSGSMNDHSRLVDLKVAAKNFVNQMSANTRDGDLSISIIPYATQVSFPDSMLPYLSLSGQNDHANCLNFADDEFLSTSMDLSRERERTLHMSSWNFSSSTYSYDNRPNAQRVHFEMCDDGVRFESPHNETDASVPRNNREILLFQKDAGAINSYIDDLTAWGNTSIDLGMKWGSALLDDSVADMIAGMADGSESATIPSDFADRPSSYSSGDAMKVIVLMTDGANTYQGAIKAPYREGPSTIWWNAQEEVYSSYKESTNQYYWHHEGIWQDHAYGAQPGSEYDIQTRVRVCNYYGCWYENQTETKEEGGNATRLDYVELWEQTTVRFVRNLLDDWMGSSGANNWYNSVVDWTYSETKDQRVRAMCDLVKSAERGTYIYSIAFEAPAAGATLLDYCASSDNHFYKVGDASNEVTIDQAFSSIGSSIRKLRLTQ
ncbi:pilus assembly protein TadG-related protein [Ruegeria hyattellae]|uniref:pilus assembly protein TadG-related protein n=1 Tax=Ruegeria hyattellae TaxID=3233337 RepID=UPI00355C2741